MTRFHFQSISLFLALCGAPSISWAVPVTSGLVTWFDGQDINGDGTPDAGIPLGTQVTTWNSRVGTTSATASTAGRIPVVGNFNGAQVVNFDGNDFLSVLNSPASYQTAFFVYNDTSTSPYTTVLGTQYSVGSRGSYHGSVNDAGLFNSANTDPVTVNGVTYRQGGVAVANKLTLPRPDAMTIDAHVATSVMTRPLMVLGMDECTTCDGGLRGINGQLGEVLLYDRLLSFNELNQVGNYLEAKYGIAWTDITEPTTTSAGWNTFTAGTHNWNDTTKWTGGDIAYGIDSTATFFGNVGGTVTVVQNLGAVLPIGHLSLGDTDSNGGWAINGGEIRLQTSVGTPTIHGSSGTPGDIGTGSNFTWINASLSGNQGFTKTGTGYIGLGGDNSNLTGQITVDGGILAIGHNNALGATGAGNGTVVNVGTLLINSVSNLPEDITMAGGTTLLFPSTVSATLSGKLTLTGNVNIRSRSGSFNFVQVTFDTPGVGGTAIDLGSSTLTFDNQGGTSNTTVKDLIVGAGGGINKAAGGVLWLAPEGGFSNTYTGNTTITVGTLRADDGIGLPTASFLTLTNAMWQTGADISRTTDTVAGADKINITGNSGFSAVGGPVTVNLNGGATLNWGSTAGFNPGTLRLQDATADSTLTFANDVNLNTAGIRTIQVDANVAEMSGVISNSLAGGITKSGAGVLFLSNNNTYSGTTNVNGNGVLRANDGVGLPTASFLALNSGIWESGVNITRNTGTSGASTVSLANAAGFSAFGAPIDVNLNGGADLTWGVTPGFNPTALVLQAATADSQLTFLNNVNLNAPTNRTIDVRGNVAEISGVISNSNTGGLTKSGVGVLVLSNANTYAGTTAVGGGTLRLNHSSALAPGFLDLGSGVSGQGVLELQSPSSFTRSLGVSGDGIVRVGNNNSAGFSAFGGPATVNLGSGSPDPLVWASTPGFNPNPLVLNAATANSTIDFQNNINFNGGLRNVRVDAGSAYVAKLSGVLSGTGNSGLIKIGTGTLELTGANTYTGETYVNDGTLILNNTTTNSGNLNVNNLANSQNKAVLQIENGPQGFARIRVGTASNSTGAVYQNGGAVALSTGASTDVLRLGSGAGAYGYYKLAGGSLSAAEIGVGVGNDAVGVMDITGGTYSSTGWVAIGRGSLDSSGVLSVNSGDVNLSGTVGGSKIGLNWASTPGAQSVLNVSGGNVNGPNVATYVLDLATGSTVVGTSGVANLRTGGTLTIAGVTATQANPTAVLNFDGGVLKATSTNAGTNFLSSSNIDGVYVYAGGATIDTNGTNVTVARSLQAPTGTGVTMINVADGGSGYIGAPMVRVTGGTGVAATAVANMVDDGSGNGTFKVGSITVTSAGVYSSAPTSVTLQGGGATNAASGLTVDTAANTSGGFTKTGAGTLTLAAASSYGGATTISGGTLKLAPENGSLAHRWSFNDNADSVGSASPATLSGTASISGGQLNITGNSAANNLRATLNSPLGYDKTLVTWFTLNNHADNSPDGGPLGVESGGFFDSIVYGERTGGQWMAGSNNFHRSGPANNGGATETVSGSPIMMAITYNSVTGKVTLYRDGELYAQYDQTINLIGYPGTANLVIGPRFQAAGYFNGSVDEARIYEGSLSASQIAALFTLGPDGLPAGIFDTSILPTTTAVDITVAGATLDINGANQTIASLAGVSGSITTSTASFASTLTLSAASGSTTFSGNITGPLSVVKDGDSTQIFAGNNSYTGTTTVKNGTLLLHGTQTGGGVITVENGGTFGGSGATDSQVVLLSGGTITTGSSPGTFTTGSQTWNGGANQLFEINDATGAAGGDPGWDLLVINGTLDLTAVTVGDPFNVIVNSLDLLNAPGTAENFDSALDYTWLFVDADDPIVGFTDPAQFNIITSGFTNPFLGTFSVVLGDSVLGGDDSQLYLQYQGFAAQVPEPASLMMWGVLVGLASGFGWVSRRRARLAVMRRPRD